MHDEPGAALRQKPDASMVRAVELVRDGHASAVVSAGNTGAFMASALLRLGRVPGVQRPAIAAVLPGTPTPTVLLDAGANVDAQPEWLVGFARMGSAYSSTRFGVESPRVALLTIGEEPGKGNQQVKFTFAMLQECKDINFVGNAEGRDLLAGRFDVIVCDGFVGNVALKSLEGALVAFGQQLQRSASDHVALGDDPGFRATVTGTLDYFSPDQRGGAVLLGVDGIAMVCHGSASADAISSGISIARQLVESALVPTIASAIPTDAS
jgi:glycerol-3-phosphate acyltransferase PlsX